MKELKDRNKHFQPTNLQVTALYKGNNQITFVSSYLLKLTLPSKK